MVTEKYLEEERKRNFRVGERVRVLRKSTLKEENDWSVGFMWVDIMDQYVGKILTIVEVYKSGGLRLKYGTEQAWNYPFFVVERLDIEISNPIEKREVIVHGEKMMLPEAIISMLEV